MGRGLPKKYAKMGFKRGWRAYKASKRRKTTRRSNPGKKTRRYVPRFKKAVRRVKKGMGSIIKGARYIDVFSRPAQGAIYRYGFSGTAFEDIKNNYTGALGKNLDVAKTTYSAIGTGLVTNYLKSRAGVYRGVGRGKILSYLQALSPEILAASRASPVSEFKQWNSWRGIYNEGYDQGQHRYSINPAENVGAEFWQDKILNIVLAGIQKFIFDTKGPIGLNRHLPKGINF